MGKRACIIIISVLLFISFVSAADDNPYLAQVQPLTENTAFQDALASAFSIMEEKLATDLKAYNDENYRMLDTRTQEFLKEFKWKTVAAILGLNLFSCGIVFYFINKNQRKLSYESVSLRKRQTEEDKQYMIQVINDIRDKFAILEQEMRQKFDYSVVPIEMLDRYAQGGVNYGPTRGRDEYGREFSGAAFAGPMEGSASPEGYAYPAQGSEFPGAPGSRGYPPEGFI